LFDFVVDVTIEENKEESALEKLNDKASLRTEDERSSQELIEAEVFKQIFIPRKLMDVDFPERAISKIKSNSSEGAEEPVYKSVTGVQLRKNDKLKSDDDDEVDEKSIKSDLDSSTSTNDEEKASKFKDSHRPRNESPNSRKERKQALKAETADKRKSKVKKHIKKRKEKVTSTKKK